AHLEAQRQRNEGTLSPLEGAAESPKVARCGGAEPPLDLGFDLLTPLPKLSGTSRCDAPLRTVVDEANHRKQLSPPALERQLEGRKTGIPELSATGGAGSEGAEHARSQRPGAAEGFDHDRERRSCGGIIVGMAERP